MGQKKSRVKMKQQKPKDAPPPTASATGEPSPASSFPNTITGDILKNRKRLGDEVMGQVWRWDDKTVMKRSGPSTTAEAAAMRFVREHTSVPVPKVLKSSADGFIFMEYIDGRPLHEAWHDCTDEQRTNIISQLRGYMAELRGVNGDFIGSIDRSICNDQIFGNCVSEYGPYVDETAFREGIAESLRACEADPTWTEVVLGFVNAMPRGHKIVFTHGDLVPRNILVRDGNVVGIVDWEMAGFYPEYWEYAKAHFFADYDHPWMQQRTLDKILKPYPVELGLLLHTRKIFDF